MKIASKTFNLKHAAHESITLFVFIHELFGSKTELWLRFSPNMKVNIKARSRTWHEKSWYQSNPHAMPHGYIHMVKDKIRHIEGMNRKIIRC